MTDGPEHVVDPDDVLVASPPRQPDRPHVAVLVSLNFPDMGEETAHLVTRFTRTALEALVDLGASYELFDTTLPLGSAVEDIQADGLLVLGGGDVSAAFSGGRDEDVPHCYGVDVRADSESMEVIRRLAEADVPVLGVCRGLHLINVAWGGTLIGDIADHRLHRGGPGEPLFIDEHITLEPGTRLADAFASRLELTVRSGHHQSIDVVAPGLQVSAVADDGLIEGLEHPDRWVLGVQWHPEDDRGPAVDRELLFTAFLRAASLRLSADSSARTKGTPHVPVSS